MRGIALLLVAMMALIGTSLLTRASAEDRARRAPEIGLADATGKVLRMAELRGSVVVVDFWASWCAPCLDALALLDGLHKAHKRDGLVVVAVGRDRQLENHLRFASAAGLSFPMVHDGDGAVATRYAVTGMPSTYLIDRRGRVRHMHAGWQASDEAWLRRELRILLAEK